MNWLQNFWRRIYRWISRQPSPLRGQKVEELPDDLEPGTIYIAGEGQFLWFVAMVCPCGCKEVIQLSLLQEGHPRWSLTQHADGTVSLHPSVLRIVGCRSHFFICKGFVDWCEPDQRL